jgi:hypothetical protein
MKIERLNRDLSWSSCIYRFLSAGALNSDLRPTDIHNCHNHYQAQSNEL